RVGEKWQVVLDGTPGTLYDSLGNDLVFTEDGKHLLYSAEHGRDGFLVVDGKELSKRGAVREASYGFDAQGRPHFVLLTREGTFVEIGDVEFGPYKDVFGGISFSAD